MVRLYESHIGDVYQMILLDRVDKISDNVYPTPRERENIFALNYCLMSDALSYLPLCPETSNHKRCVQMDWQKRIDIAKKNDGFTEDDCYAVNVWASCSLSERPELPKNKAISSCLTLETINIRSDFADYVLDDDIKSAEHTLKKLRHLEVALR